jgi:dipeptidase E
MSAELFLMSSSRVFGGGYLEYAHDALRDFLGATRTVHFVPFAIADYERYTRDVALALEPFGVSVVGLHTLDVRRAVDEAQTLFVGGGKFPPAEASARASIDRARQAARRPGDLRHSHASAGSNMACPSLRTTNDMPIVQPSSFEASGPSRSRSIRTTSIPIPADTWVRHARPGPREFMKKTTWRWLACAKGHGCGPAID